MYNSYNLEVTSNGSYHNFLQVKNKKRGFKKCDFEVGQNSQETFGFYFLNGIKKKSCSHGNASFMHYSLFERTEMHCG